MLKLSYHPFVIFCTCFCAAFLFKNGNAQNIGINAGGNPPDPSAILDVSSTIKGFLLTRMTTVQRDAISNPAESLLIFNTDTKCFQAYVNGQWQNIFCDLGCSVPPPPPGTISGNPAPCENASGISYSITQVAGATSYVWTVPAGASIIAGQGTTGIAVNFGITSGSISVIAANNCGVSTAQTVNITLQTPPAQPGPVAGTGTVCQGQTGVVYSVTNVPGVTYTWTYSGSGFSVAAGQGTNSITADFSASATSGTLSVTPASACGTGTPQTFAVSVITVPSAPSAGTQTPSQTQIVWNWNTVAGADGYKYNTVNDYSSAIDNGTSATYTQTGLTCNTAYTLYVWAYNYCGNSVETTLSLTTSPCCIPGSQTFAYTGNSQPFTVSSGCATLTVKMWGGGGAGGQPYYTPGDGGGGGGAGYAEAQIAAIGGEVLDVFVGGGGTSNNPGIGGFNGGGNGGGPGSGTTGGGGGGGASDLRRAGTKLIIAAGGGGGGGVDASPPVGNNGGAGGGLNGSDGNVVSGGGGGGGTQTTGGTAGGSGATAGSLGQGGQGATRSVNQGSGGGGGGGYYGGGGGSELGSSQEGHGGGGGSSFIPAGGTTLSGSGSTPGNAGDSQRGSAGDGGASETNGQPGKVIISW